MRLYADPNSGFHRTNNGAVLRPETINTICRARFRARVQAARAGRFVRRGFWGRIAGALALALALALWWAGATALALAL